MAKYGLMLALNFFLFRGSLQKLHYLYQVFQHNKLEALSFTVWYVSYSTLDENVSEKMTPVPSRIYICLLKVKVSAVSSTLADCTAAELHANSQLL